MVLRVALLNLARVALVCGDWLALPGLDGLSWDNWDSLAWTVSALSSSRLAWDWSMGMTEVKEKAEGETYKVS